MIIIWFEFLNILWEAAYRTENHLHCARQRWDRVLHKWNVYFERKILYFWPWVGCSAEKINCEPRYRGSYSIEDDATTRGRCWKELRGARLYTGQDWRGRERVCWVAEETCIVWGDDYTYLGRRFGGTEDATICRHQCKLTETILRDVLSK